MTAASGADERSQQARWEEAHAQPRFRPRYPHEQVVRWTFRHFDRAARPAAKLLDLGCGAGRHALFFAEEGFDACACDISRAGLEQLQASAQARGLAIPTVHTSAHDLSAYPDARIDGVVSFGVLYYLSLAEAGQAVREVHRVLRPGGQFFCVVRTDADSRREGAVAVAPCTWRLPQLGEGAASDLESGMDMLFFSRADVERLFAPFAQVSIDRMSYRQDTFTDDDWVVSAIK
jgi:SAM-dependent methyltransferase